MTSTPGPESLVIGVDLGTGGPKVALASARGDLIGLESASVPTRILPGGGAEQDPDDWWQAVAGCVRRLLALHPGSARRVRAICFSSQWGGTVPVDEQGYAPHLYIGTSAWLTCHVPRKKTDVFRNIASMPSVVPDRYWVATIQNVAGKAIDWLIDNVLDQHGPARSAQALAELNALAAKAPPGSHGVIFTPWLNGERTPVDDVTLRGAWLNLSLQTRREDLARAVFEGIACNTRWMLDAVEHFTGRTGPRGLGAIRFIGGGATSRLWCQTLADILRRPIDQLEHPAAANARGAALLAGIAIGAVTWTEIPDLVHVCERFEPDSAHRDVYDQAYAAFRGHYRKNRAIYAKLNAAEPA
jgi:xylulokinase